jgi:transcription initiation factor IIE alpha subunit
MKKFICKVLGRHKFTIATAIDDGYVFIECPYCGEKLFEYGHCSKKSNKKA